MKNSLQYFYNININELNKIDDNYYFNFQNNNFVVMEYKREDEEALEIYKLNLYMLNFINTYIIIPTIYNSLLFEFESKKYILMKIPDLQNRIITINDLLNPILISDNYKYIDKSNWDTLWEEKIDFYEDLIANNKVKYNDKMDSVFYYIGMWENGIEYFKNSYNISLKYVSHIRMSSDMYLLDFLNPLELIIDYKARDIGEYIKSYVFSYNYSMEDINNIFMNINLDREDVILLISRILFPSYFFDNIDNDTYEYIKKRTNIIILIKFLFDKYKYYNIEYITWISK